jgi:hypothetical protein
MFTQQVKSKNFPRSVYSRALREWVDLNLIGAAPRSASV